MMICLIAAPSVRTMCPPEYTEGLWLEIPEQATKVDLSAPGAGLYVLDDDGKRLVPDPDYEVPVVQLIARPNGKMVRRADDLLSAPVFEIRLAEEWDD